MSFNFKAFKNYYEKVKQPGDGNCFFHSLLASKICPRTEGWKHRKRVQKLRDDIVDVIEDNKTDFFPLFYRGLIIGDYKFKETFNKHFSRRAIADINHLDENEVIDEEKTEKKNKRIIDQLWPQYLKEMRKVMYAGSAEVQAAVDRFRRPIIVVIESDEDAEDVILLPIMPSYSDKNYTLADAVVLHRSFDHYDSYKLRSSHDSDIKLDEFLGKLFKTENGQEIEFYYSANSESDSDPDSDSDSDSDNDNESMNSIQKEDLILKLRAREASALTTLLETDTKVKKKIKHLQKKMKENNIQKDEVEWQVFNSLLSEVNFKRSEEEDIDPLTCHVLYLEDEAENLLNLNNMIVDKIKVVDEYIDLQDLHLQELQEKFGGNDY